MMSDIAKDRMAHSVRKRGSVSSLSGHEFWQKELHGCTKKWVTECLIPKSDYWINWFIMLIRRKKSLWDIKRDKMGKYIIRQVHLLGIYFRKGKKKTRLRKPKWYVDSSSIFLLSQRTLQKIVNSKEIPYAM